MVEKILGERQAEDIFFAAMLTGLMNEKQASDVLNSIEKDAEFSWLKFFGGLGKAISGTATAGWEALKTMPSAVAWTAALGGGLGALGANVYDSMEKRLTEEDPEVKLNEDREMIYAAKERELNDAKWMNRARRLRDALKRAAKNKNVTNERYKKDFDELIAMLGEKK